MAAVVAGSALAVPAAGCGHPVLGSACPAFATAAAVGRSWAGCRDRLPAGAPGHAGRRASFVRFASPGWRR